jgi:hypothetical protein
MRVASAQAPPSDPYAPHEHAAQAPADDMMAAKNAEIATLRALADAMNAASGDAKIDAIARLLTEMVDGQERAHRRMSEMHGAMMKMMKRMPKN